MIRFGIQILMVNQLLYELQMKGYFYKKKEVLQKLHYKTKEKKTPAALQNIRHDEIKEVEEALTNDDSAALVKKQKRRR